MYSYLNEITTKDKLVKNMGLDYFYWKYVYGDIIISKFITFLVKNGYKNKAIRFFFKALFNLKLKFGINPILLIKYVILKRNVLHKVTKKRVKQKTFFYLRLLDFDKQISNTIRKIMEFVLFLKNKKHLKLWQSIFIVLLNFCLSKNKTKNRKNVTLNVTSRQLSFNKAMLVFRVRDVYKKLVSSFFRIYFINKHVVYLLSLNCKLCYLVSDYVETNRTSIDYNTSMKLLGILFYNKYLFYYLWSNKYNLSFFLFRYSDKLKAISLRIKKLQAALVSFYKKHKKYKVILFDRYRRKKLKLSKNKNLLRRKLRKNFLTKFFFKELIDLKKASKFKNSFLNFKLLNKKKRELEMGTRIHSKHDVRLRHRKIFFRVSKHGQK